MIDDTTPLFSFPAVEGKKVTAAFDGGRISSDGGVMLLTIADMICARVFAICCGYEDGDDLDDLRHDLAFKLASLLSVFANYLVIIRVIGALAA